MKRLTRITAILLRLQAKRLVVAQELADEFEVSLRTIYRDINTLQEAGVPIGAENGLGYFLADGYSLPPLMINREEAQALLTSEKLVLNQGDASLIRNFSSLLLKVKALLNSSELEALEILSERIQPSVQQEKRSSHWLADIQNAIAQCQVLAITYHSGYKEEVTQRKVEPLALSFTEKSWYLLAFCRLRKDFREFRLDRILQLHISAEHFPPYEGFNFADFLNGHQNKLT